ncbi:hypothetical protein [Hyalangium minutum]|uniref:hypothetical protein n=1 Tax=Hyalangium minutum TaxID=394096 RepID=UPI0012FB0602|nr:hypothetical protein [Hyalangium minutum]
MRRALPLILALVLPSGAALGQEAPQSAPPPPAEPPPPPAAQEPPPPEAPSLPQAPPAPAQESKPGMETLISGDVSSGGFGGPVFMYSRVQGRDALFFGGRGGWLANHHFVLGAGGFALVSRIAPPAGAPDVGEDLRTEFAYGGLWLEYILLPDKLVHASIGTLLGGGAASYSRIRRMERQDREVESDVVFTVEPVISVELNLTRFLRLSAGAGYRHVASVELTGLRQEDLSGFTGSVMLKFGRF